MGPKAQTLFYTAPYRFILTQFLSHMNLKVGLLLQASQSHEPSTIITATLSLFWGHFLTLLFLSHIREQVRESIRTTTMESLDAFKNQSSREYTLQNYNSNVGIYHSMYCRKYCQEPSDYTVREVLWASDPVRMAPLGE